MNMRGGYRDRRVTWGQDGVFTVSMAGSRRMGVVPGGQEGVNPESKGEITGARRVIRMEGCHEGVVSGEESLALRLSGAQTPGSGGAPLSVHSLVGVGAKGQQELHSRAVAQQRREEEPRLPSGVLTIHLDN